MTEKDKQSSAMSQTRQRPLLLPTNDTSVIQWSDLQGTSVCKCDTVNALAVRMPTDDIIYINGIRFNMRTLLTGRK